MIRTTLAVCAVVFVSGCGSPQSVLRPVVDFRYVAEPIGKRPFTKEEVVFAGGTAGWGDDASAAQIYSLLVLVQHTREFFLEFPDGWIASSRVSTRQEFESHIGSIGRKYGFRSDLGLDFLVAYSGDATRVSLSFSGSQLESLSICTEIGLSLGASSAVKLGVDKGGLTGMPMRYADMVKLFGQPSKVSRDLMFFHFC
jgi:hypothetical protein